MRYRTSLQDIADKAGISKAAVSMALRNDPSIGAATRARIRKLARRMNYNPDPVLARVAAQRWRRPMKESLALMALIFHNTFRRAPEEWIVPSRKQAKSLGYKLEVFEVSDFESPEQLSDVLYSRGVSGVVLGQVYTADFCERFSLGRFTAVAAHLGYNRPPLHLVTPDRWNGTFSALEKVHAAGHRRAAVALLDEPGAIDIKDKLSAALYAKSELFKTGDALFIEKFRLTQQAEFAAWIREIRPQAVIGFNNTIYGWLRKWGFKVPDEISFVALDSSPNPSIHWDLVVSGVWPQDDLVLKTAVELLDSQIRTHQTGIPKRQLTVFVDGAWVPGATFIRRKR